MIESNRSIKIIENKEEIKEEISKEAIIENLNNKNSNF